MIDGPYGGLSLDLAEFESVLLVAGGAGVTFTLGVLDDLVGRIAKLGRQGGEKTKRIEFVWYMRSYGKRGLAIMSAISLCLLCRLYPMVRTYAPTPR